VPEQAPVSHGASFIGDWQLRCQKINGAKNIRPGRPDVVIMRAVKESVDQLLNFD